MNLAQNTADVYVTDKSVLAMNSLKDRFARYITKAAAILVLLMLGGVMLALVEGAWPAIKQFGPGFISTVRWNPVTEIFGAKAPIYGTLVTSLIAMLIGVPVGIGSAIFITELSPIWLKQPISTAI